MNTIKLTIKQIKNIISSSVELPISKGIYAIVGQNGCGKSTLMQCLAKVVFKSSLENLRNEDYDAATSYIEVALEGNTARWSKPQGVPQWRLVPGTTLVQANGMYEGSLFYGTRFNDSTQIDAVLSSGQLQASSIVDADQYIKDKMSYILHGDLHHYRTLKRIVNRTVARNCGFDNMPYFIETSRGLVSQYRMSSGECLLVSLLHFLYNSIERRSLPAGQLIMVLVDEIELALHPIAVKRLMELLQDLVANHPSLVVYLSSHSPEVIKTIPPSNLYKVSTKNGVLTVENNCYPSYLIRDLYCYQGPDFLILTEDILATRFVNAVLTRHNLRSNKLVQVVPVGGWSNVLELHNELVATNMMGINCRITSLLDGDVQTLAHRSHPTLRKLFLPIASIEKYLYKVVHERGDATMRKLINDKYFIIRSLDEIVADFDLKYKTVTEKLNKEFYSALIDELNNRNITEDSFITSLCTDILDNVNYASFKDNLEQALM